MKYGNVFLYLVNLKQWLYKKTYLKVFNLMKKSYAVCTTLTTYCITTVCKVAQCSMILP